MAQPDFSDRKVIAKLDKAARVRAKQDALTVRGLMDNMAGRQFIYHKLESAHIFTTSFSTNALQMAFNEGQRNRGLDLLMDIMTHCPDQYVLMMREANERNAANERALSANDRGDDSGSDTDYNAGQLDLYTEFDRSVTAGTVRIAATDDDAA